ncbi:phosphoribosyltransferase family protein [uncultured Dialister sp.]|uniref:phosphoribosyltransferase family protein n=1 Tax=uncultured Dialister sp. TaxID=278064 RepID=UPI0025D82262|nr:phosphoribosyltransferase family protein [uncultured Dialister sp.]
MAKRYYELHVAGCTRQLPVLNISEKMAIAGFVILGDTEIVVNCAKELAKKVPEGTEVIFTAETKGIPLAHELAKELGMKSYVCARKSVKAYMEDPIWVEDESITTAGKQRLYLSDSDIDLVKGKNVLLVDDVISTGGSMKAMEQLVAKAGGKVVGEAAILAEGDAAKRKDIIFLEPLPLFDAE